jgi:hypothetical protein
MKSVRFIVEFYHNEIIVDIKELKLKSKTEINFKLPVGTTNAIVYDTLKKERYDVNPQCCDSCQYEHEVKIRLS